MLGKFPNPTVDDDTTIKGQELHYISNITNLSLNTTYYVRAYATNSIGTGYGDERAFLL